MLNLSRTLQSRLASLTLSADPYSGLDIPSPADFGIPGQYTEWRKWQYATVERILGSTKRFFGLCMPCGSGKSLCGVAAAILGGKRTVILTSTLGLQSQISNDFSDISIDIRGMSNYPCVIATSLGLNVDTNVSEAPCQLGYKCSLRFGGGCDYYDQYREAQRSQIITTNYQCWLWDGCKEKGSLHIPRADYDHSKEMGNGVDDPRLPVDMLICDECFVSGTAVGGRGIETIRVGDSVPSFDGAKIVENQVIRTYRHRPIALCRVQFTDGSSVVCTPNHPFMTKQGWRAVSDLLLPSEVLQWIHGQTKDKSTVQSRVCSLQEAVYRSGAFQESRPEVRVLLQPSVQRNITPDSTSNIDHQVCFLREDENAHKSQLDICIFKKPFETFLLQSRLLDESQISEIGTSRIHRRVQAAVPTENAGQTRRSCGEQTLPRILVGEDGRETSCAGGQWEATASPTGPSSESSQLGYGGSSSHPYEARQRPSDSLQDRYSGQTTENRSRGGWSQSSSSSYKTTGSEEGKVLNWVRVENIEILEPTSDGTFGGLCPDGFVYNLEVENTHTYVANNCVVHNCDLAEDELARFVSVDISRRESLHLGLIWPDAGHDIDSWKQWADENLPDVESRLKGIEKRLEIKNTGEKSWSKDLKALRDMKRKLSKLSGMRVEDEWVLQETDGDDRYGGKRGEKIVNLKSVTFSPLAPARYAESALWRGVEKVVLMSATVRPKTLELLGIDESDIEFIEFPSTFPVERRPVIHVPSVQMNYRTEQDDQKMMLWLSKLDAIIKPRLGYKGVIHGVSYKRCQFIKDNSEFGQYMVTHNSRDKASVIDSFERANAPAILVSPVVDTGYNFFDDRARWQVISKIPFASTQDKLVKARQQRDPEYAMYQVAQILQQMTGRVVRSEQDWAETIVLDDNFFWVLPRIKKFVAESWLQAVKRCEGLPEVIEF